ncbi:MAG TPA: N-acetyltransferase [Caulobacter sp.]|nr:N-acetyltransferase [Caulobacter sp.]
MLTYDLRPFRLDDAPAVNSLCDWAWWPQRSEAGWAWLAEGPPGARGPEDVGPPGWVCEKDGQVVAFLGNFVQRFRYGEEILRGASGHTFLAHPGAKGAGRMLLRAFAEQPGRFAIYLFNANAISATHYRHYAIDPWPETTHTVKYRWWVDLPAAIGERLLWKISELRGFEGVRARGERFISDRLRAGEVTRFRPGVRLLAESEVDERFDELWVRMTADGRLLAARDGASLRWRLADPDLTRRPVILGYEQDGRLTGYLLAYFAKQTEIERASLDIVDLVATAETEAVAIPALVGTLVSNARDLGVVRVRLQTVSPGLDEILSPLAGAQRIVTHGHCHARFAEGLPAGALEAWQVTPYDGDYSFCLRPPPLAATQAA